LYIWYILDIIILDIVHLIRDFLWFLGNPGVCRQIPQSSMLRNVDWATHTCVISFETIGIWPEGADGTDVNNCTRSGDGKLLATGDDFGKVKLFSHPACQPKVIPYNYFKLFYIILKFSLLSKLSIMRNTY